MATPATPVRTYVWPSRILLILAVICFVLGAFRVSVVPIDLVDIGLALGFGAFLVP